MYRVFYLLVLIPFMGFSQTPKNWQHLDPEDDSVLGISTYQAYEYLKGRKSDTVVVAVIDNGVELTHEDLEGKIWVNDDEIPGNQIDDDQNGYVDDINGWNFLGNPEGNNLKHETLELTRLFAYYHKKYSDKGSVLPDTIHATEFDEYQKIREDYESEVNQKKEEMAFYLQLVNEYYVSDSIIKAQLKKETYNEKQVNRIRSNKLEVITAKEIVLKFMGSGVNVELLEKRIVDLANDLELRLNPDLRVREEIVMDNPQDIHDTIYGNNMLDVMGPSHGTGVAGAVGALKNMKGMDGVADAVKIMVLRVVPNGDERDKDVALAIKYAVRNGADIINCSFGKKYSAQPGFVQDAITEAEKNDVLIVHAAGNDGTDTDKTRYYPSGILSNGEISDNWITVGASMSKDNESLLAQFSNYGETTVDVFAPGYKVTTCTLNNEYDAFSGTSISAPIVSGVAAVLKSYFSYLSAAEIKEIIVKSAYVPKTTNVLIPGESDQDKANLSELSVSGGIVNLYRAVVLADTEYGKE